MRRYEWMKTEDVTGATQVVLRRLEGRAHNLSSAAVSSTQRTAVGSVTVNDIAQRKEKRAN